MDPQSSNLTYSLQNSNTNPNSRSMNQADNSNQINQIEQIDQIDIDYGNIDTPRSQISHNPTSKEPKMSKPPKPEKPDPNLKLDLQSISNHTHHTTTHTLDWLDISKIQPASENTSKVLPFQPVSMLKSTISSMLSDPLLNMLPDDPSTSKFIQQRILEMFTSFLDDFQNSMLSKL